MNNTKENNFAGYIYFIKNKVTNKYYVGATVNFERRMRQHLCKSRYTDWRTDLHDHPENYTWGILEVVYADDFIDLNLKLCDAEMRHYEELSKEHQMFNMTKPSINTQRGTKYSDERRLKAKESHIGKPHKSKVDEGLRDYTRDIFRTYTSSNT